MIAPNIMVVYYAELCSWWLGSAEYSGCVENSGGVARCVRALRIVLLSAAWLRRESPSGVHDLHSARCNFVEDVLALALQFHLRWSP